MPLYKENYPNEAVDNQFQAESGVQKGYKLELKSMPTIELQVSQGGKEGTSPSSVTQPGRERYDISPANPETNLHEQFLDVNSFEHSEGAFNS